MAEETLPGSVAATEETPLKDDPAETQPLPPAETLDTEPLIDISATRYVDFETGHHNLQGRRKHNEDAYGIWPHPQINELAGIADGVHRSLFAVFDGHGGDASAIYCQDFMNEAMSEVIKEHLDAGDKYDPRACLRTMIDRLEAEMEEDVGVSGNTAIIAYVENDALFISNIGDSRAVLSNETGVFWASEDHKPDAPSEIERILGLGGIVSVQDPEASCIENCVFGMAMLREDDPPPFRVWPGGLSLSRSVGDFSAKPYVNSEATITQFSLQSEHKKLLLACDGIWDVCSNEEAMAVVLKESSPQKACELITDDALNERGSGDNLSALVIHFSPFKTIGEPLTDSPKPLTKLAGGNTTT